MEQCKVCRNGTVKKYYHDNKDARNEYRANNRDKINKAASKWRQNNKDTYNGYKRKRYEWEKNDPVFKLKKNLRRRINFALDGTYKADSTLSLLGCTPDEFRAHLESLFTEGMSWENYGVYKLGGEMTWHVDHIKPCDSFDLTDESQQLECFHYSNMQPLWAEENLKKGSSTDAAPLSGS
jgi:hypothetical protein